MVKNKSICFIAPFAYPLVIGSGSGPGGAERQFFLFAKELQKLGWSVSFITDTPDQTAKDYSPQFPVFPASFSYLGGNNLCIPRDWLSLYFAMLRADSKYYVLKVPGHLLFPMYFFASLYNKRIVFWAQMSFDANPVERKLNKYAGYMQDWGTRHAHYVIAQTREQKKYFFENYKIRAFHVPSICSSLDSECENNIKYEKSQTNVDVLWVGNSMPKKRYTVAIELARLLPRVRFALAMNKSVAFDQAAREAQRIPNIDFLGQVSPFEMEKWYQQTKIFLNTSSSEGFPNTFLQSWMHGVPVLSLDIDPDNLIKYNNLGRIVAYHKRYGVEKNPVILAKSLIPYVMDLLGNHLLRQRMSFACMQYVEKNHAPQFVIPKLLQVFDQRSV
jgi:glycosyltransferase involved in cell wall biosynthesis